MTNTKNTKAHRVPVYRRPIFLIAAAVIVCAVIIAIIILLQKTPSNQISPQTPSASQPPNDQENQQKPDQEKPEEPEKVTQFEGGDPNDLQELTGHIAYHGITGNTLTVTASIDQFLSETGNCQLELSQNEQTVYTENLPAKADVTTSVCGPFEVPIQDFSSGTYQIKIIVTADDKTGTIIGETTI